MHPIICMHEHFDLITNSFKYKCKNLASFYTCISKNCDECKMQIMNNGFNTFKMYDWTHVQILIVQKMWKKSLTRSNINVKH
jgi:hypothetical protein